MILISNKSFLHIRHCIENSISCKAFFCIIFDEVDEYIRKYDTTKYLGLFHSDEKHERIFDRIRYLITLKNIISDVYSHKFKKISINWDVNLLLDT